MFSAVITNFNFSTLPVSWNIDITSLMANVQQSKLYISKDICAGYLLRGKFCT